MAKVPLMINDLPNPTMRWEKSYTFETGFDIGFLNNKYILNFTYYNRRTQDKFAEITLPSHSGVSSFLSNNGEVQNQGYGVRTDCQCFAYQRLEIYS